MIMDFHTHIFPEKIAGKTLSLLAGRCHINPASDGTEAGILDSMEKAGIACSVILPVVTAPGQFGSITKFASYINEKYGYFDRSWEKGKFPRLISFGGIHPDSLDYRGELRSLADAGFAGIKLHPDYQETFFSDIRYKRIISYAAELGLIVVTHAGVDIGMPETIHCTPSMVTEVLQETQADKLILAHYGGYGYWDEIEQLYQEEIWKKGQVYLDTAFIQNDISSSQFVRILQKAGYDHVLFATDSPWMEQKKAVEWLKEKGLSDFDTENIGFWNGASLLGIGRQDFLQK